VREKYPLLFPLWLADLLAQLGFGRHTPVKHTLREDCHEAASNERLGSEGSGCV
jgi:hypothetical protein